jgi:hypothetical protein
MASIITVHAKGNTLQEVNKNLETIDSYMNSQQNLFILVSSTRPNFNPRIYYSELTIIPKSIHNITIGLKTGKTINQAVKSIAYSGHLNKV